MVVRGEVVAAPAMTVGWAWDVSGSTDNHVPERFTPIQFSTAYVDDLPKAR